MIAEKQKENKWQSKRSRLMKIDTYRIMISRIEGDAEMFHRINLALTVMKQQPGAAYTPVGLKGSQSLA
jgi:hypothetical protein